MIFRLWKARIIGFSTNFSALFTTPLIKIIPVGKIPAGQAIDIISPAE
jgi:hypothetical protein